MKKPVKNALSLFFGDVVTRIFGFITTAYLARVLGVESFGRIGFAQAILTYGIVSTNFGLLTIGTRDIAKDRSQIKGLVNNILGLRLVLTLIAFGLTLIFIGLIPKPTLVKQLLLFYTISLFAQSLLLEWVFEGIERMEYIGIARVLSSAFYLGLTILIIKSSGQLLTVPIIYFFSQFFGVLLLFSIYLRSFGLAVPQFNLKAFRKIFIVALPVGIASVMAQIYSNFGIVALSFLATDTDLGLYNAAFRLVTFILLIDRVFYTTFLPVISRYFAAKSGRIKELIETLTKLILTIALPICIGGMVLAKGLIIKIFGLQYSNCTVIFQIIIWFFLLTIMNSLYGFGLIGAGREKLFARNIGIGTICTIGSVIILSYRFGAIGAAIATLGSEAIMVILMYSEFSRIVKTNPFKYLMIPLFSSLLMGIVLYLLRPIPVVFLILIGILVYGLLVLAAGGIKKEEIGLIRR